MKTVVAIVAACAIGICGGYLVGKNEGYTLGFSNGWHSASNNISIDATMAYLTCLSDHCDTQKHTYNWVGKWSDENNNKWQDENGNLKN